jgi:hypothetical protein
MHSLKIARFDASVLTVEPRDNDWSVFRFAKVETHITGSKNSWSKFRWVEVL